MAQLSTGDCGIFTTGKTYVRVDHVHQSEPLEWVTLQEIAESLQRVTHSKGSDW